MFPLKNVARKGLKFCTFHLNYHIKGQQLFHVKSLNINKVSNIRRTKCQHLNDSRLVLQLSVPNPLKPSVKSIMKM